MTTAEKMEAKVKSTTDAQLVEVYSLALRARHGDNPMTAIYDELGIAIRYMESEMDERGIDVEDLITKVLGR